MSSYPVTIDKRKGTVEVTGSRLILTRQKLTGPERTEVDLGAVTTVETKRQHVRLSGPGIDVGFGLAGFSAMKRQAELLAEIDAGRG